MKGVVNYRATKIIITFWHHPCNPATDQSCKRINNSVTFVLLLLLLLLHCCYCYSLITNKNTTNMRRFIRGHWRNTIHKKIYIIEFTDTTYILGYAILCNVLPNVLHFSLNKLWLYCFTFHLFLYFDSQQI